MDSRLRQLIRDFQAAPDVNNAQTLIRSMQRGGAIPPPVQGLLDLVTNQTGLPSLYFVCGTADENENDALEASRINWLRNTFTEQRYLWLIICRNLIDFAAHHLLQNDLQSSFESLLTYNSDRVSAVDIASMRRPRRRRGQPAGWDIRYPRHQTDNGVAEYQLLREDTLAALALLQHLGPRTGNLPTAVLESQIIVWERWSALTSEEGWLTYDGSNHEEWAQYNNLQGVVYNLVETFHHMFLSLVGRAGDPHEIGPRRAFNKAYTGGPFLKHWTREHGSLNPGHHLNFGEITRLNELVMPDGKIDWFVVFSNCLVGSYFTYTWILRARGREPIFDVAQKRSELETQYNALEEQNRNLLHQHLNVHQGYLKLIERANGKLSTGQRTRVENQMAAIETQVSQNVPELQAIDNQLQELANAMDASRDADNLNKDVMYERRFWRDTQPVFYISIAEYLSAS